MPTRRHPVEGLSVFSHTCQKCSLSPISCPTICELRHLGSLPTHSLCVLAHMNMKGIDKRTSSCLWILDGDTIWLRASGMGVQAMLERSVVFPASPAVEMDVSVSLKLASQTSSIRVDRLDLGCRHS